jgi:hypothetical protein
MSHLLRIPVVPGRRIALAALVSALLGAAAFIATSPGTASAATGSCDPGDFCMYYLFNQSGGLYEFSGSDSNLANDHFENTNTDQVVNNNTFSVWNRGVNDPNGLVDVVVFDGFNSTGAGLCVRQGHKVNLPGGWLDRISSYKWVTHATCNRFAQI